MTGADMIAAERLRQIAALGYDPEHDVDHDTGELVSAAVCYAECAHSIMGSLRWASSPAIMRRYPDEAIHILSDPVVDLYPASGPRNWPWEVESWKPSPDPIRNLVKAGALIAAELDRLQRKTLNSTIFPPEDCPETLPVGPGD